MKGRGISIFTIVIFLSLAGAVVGSFLNVCITRFPLGESIIFPSSHCPTCKKRLFFWDLIPLVSYSLLGGRCRYCKKKIALRYLLVEGLSMLAFVGLFFLFSDLVAYFFTLGLVLLLLVVFFTDLEREIIPDQVVAAGIGLGLAYAFYQGKVWNAVAALLTGYLFFWVVSKLAYWYYKKEAIGQGDLKFGAMLGACLGFPGIVVALFLSYLIGALVVLFLVMAKLKNIKEQIPFGPFLVAGTLLVLFFGNYLTAWYFGLLR